MPLLDQVPDEIIRAILLFVSAEDNLANLQLLSHRLSALANEPLLWRYYCRVSFKFWAPEHHFPLKLAARAPEVAWKDLWLQRKRANVQSAKLLDQLLDTKVGRLGKLGQICRLGYDAKDFLLEQCRTDESAEDYLSRRYFAHTALGSVHRSIAVQEWYQYQTTPVSADRLGRSLGGFDMFVLGEGEEDMDEIERLLDQFAARFREDYLRLDEMTTRQKALALLRWVRRQNLTGMPNPEENYRNIRNCLLGQALTDPEHPSLPIISTAIYCCLARRVGLDAECCAFPTHVHAAVFAPPAETLDGKPCSRPANESEKIFLDPYGSDEEVPIAELRTRLVQQGWSSFDGVDVYLRGSPTAVIVKRTAQNLKASWNRARELSDRPEAAAELKKLRSGHPDLNIEGVLYGALWAGLLVAPPSSLHWDEQLEGLLGRFVQNFSEDAWIVEKWLLPLYGSFVSSHPNGRFRFGWQDAGATLSMVHNLDRRPPTAHRRYTEEICTKVRHKIGQVFRHKRYHYVGIINGWALDDTNALPTPHNMSMDETFDVSDTNIEEPASPRLQTHTRQPFYTCLKTGVDRHVVAQDNVQIITDASLIPETIFFLAGKFFKKFDRETCTFVSNIKEFFPDD